MSRIALTQRDYRRRTLRRDYVPVISAAMACLVSLMPVVVSAPLAPDIPFLFLIAWRLLRPEMWGAGLALPLGLLNDLVAGHPLGQSMALWTLAFLALEVADSRNLFRDYWMDWLFASLTIAGYVFACWLVGWAMGSRIAFHVMLPQLLASILAYPVVARVVLALDRWRFAR